MLLLPAAVHIDEVNEEGLSLGTIKAAMLVSHMFSGGMWGSVQHATSYLCQK